MTQVFRRKAQNPSGGVLFSGFPDGDGGRLFSGRGREAGCTPVLLARV